MKICPRCKNKITNDNATFCNKCGYDLSKPYQKVEKKYFHTFGLSFAIIYSILSIAFLFLDWTHYCLNHLDSSLPSNGNIIELIRYVLFNHKSTFVTGLSIIYIILLIILLINSFILLFSSIFSFVKKDKIKSTNFILMISFIINFILFGYFGATGFAGTILFLFSLLYLFGVTCYHLFTQDTSLTNKIIYSIASVSIIITLFCLPTIQIYYQGYACSGIIGFLLQDRMAYDFLLVIDSLIWILAPVGGILFFYNKIKISSIIFLSITVFSLIITIIGALLTNTSEFYGFIAILTFALIASSFSLVYDLKNKNTD